VIGAVLAGGAGRRLGGSKATVQLGGRPLLAYALGALRGALEHGRGAVVVLTAPAAVRDALAADGGMAGTHQPALSLMRAVKDQFDPSHRMAPGRFPEGI